MVPPKNSDKNDDLPSDGKDEKTDTIANDTHEAQLNAMYAANAFRPFPPGTAVGASASVSTIPFSITSSLVVT